MPPEIATIVSQSQFRETVLLVFLVIFCVGYLTKVVLPFFRSRTAVAAERRIFDEIEDARVQSIRIITTKDGDGNYIILSFPRMMREMIGEMRDISTKLTHLVNHQSKMMDKINEDGRLLRKRVERIEQT